MGKNLKTPNHIQMVVVDKNINKFSDYWCGKKTLLVEIY